jgi:hypothetical protein
MARYSAGSRHVRRILNCKPSREVERDWRFEHAVGAEVVAAPTRLPASVDLRATWWTIADQGRTGSCVGWATADSVLRFLFVKAGRLGEKELLSPRFVWMAAKESDEFSSQPTTFIEQEGTSLKAALDVARKLGVVPEKTLPFASRALFQGEAQTFYALAATRKIAAYFNLGREPGKWRTWLATKGPILARLEIDATWDDAKRSKGNLDTYQASTARGGHAVALVGYTKDRFIVRNSWGKATWGDGGFGYASEAYSKAAFCEAYGVTL